MSNNVKIELISIANTFGASFLASAGAILATGSITWTTAFWTSLAIAAIRSGVKAVVKQFTPVALGGVK